MTAIVIIPALTQLLLPLLLVAWVAFGRHPYRGRWWLMIALAWTWIAAIGVAGLWLALPWYLYLVYAALLAAAMVATWRREVDLPFWPRSARSRIGAVLLAALVLGAGAIVTYAIDGRRAPSAGVEASFPLRAGTYLIVNGGRNSLISAHVATLSDEARYRPWRGQSYGLDIVKLGTAGLRAPGFLPQDPSRYASFGDPVHAPCTGSVVVATDGVPDQPVPRMNRAHMAGNHVILECNGIWIVLAHLRRGSVVVQTGEPVESGRIVGEVGNSGNSAEPHLHIHAQRPGTTAEPLGGEPLPIRFDGRYLVRNQRLSRTDGRDG
jgi:hypothetical protein